MGLNIRQGSSIKFKAIATLIAGFALVMQPMYGLITDQIVNAAPATNLFGPATATVTSANTYNTGSVDTTDHNNRKVLFEYDHEELDNGDSFTYEVSVHGVPQGPVTINGVNGDTPGWQQVVAYDEAASANNISLAVSVDANVASDKVELRNIVVTGEPVNPPELVNIDSYFVKSSYKGISTDLRVNNLTDAIGVEVRVDRSSGGPVIKTAKQKVLNAINTGAAVSQTAPIIIQGGSYDETGSSSWNPATGNPWTDTTEPTKVTVTITRSGGANLVGEKTLAQIGTSKATLAEVMPAAAGPVANIDTGETFATIQEAIDDTDTVATNTIRLDQDAVLTASLNVTKSVTIDGNGHKINANFAKTSNSNNSAINTSNQSNVTFKNMTVDGASGTDLHGIKLYKGGNILLDNITAKNFRYGVQVNGSEVTVNNLTTSGNSWAPVEVDQASTSNPAQLTVVGTSTHAETQSFGNPNFLAHIWMPDSTRAVGVIDSGSQYDINSVGNARAYVLKTDTDAPAMANLNFDKFINDNSGRILKVTADITDPSGVKSAYIRFSKDGIEKTYNFAKVSGDTYEAVVDTTELVANNNFGEVKTVLRLCDDLNNCRSTKPQPYRDMGFDNSGPSSSLISPVSGTVVSGNTQLVLGFTDDSGVASARVRLRGPVAGGEKWYNVPTVTDTNGVLPIDTTELPDGEYTVDIRPVDVFGSPRSSKDKGTIIVDNSAPVISNVTPSNGDRISKTTRFSADVTDASGIQKVALYLRNQDGSNNEYALTKGAGDNWFMDVDTKDLAGDGEYDVVLRAVANDGVPKVTYFNNRKDSHSVFVDNSGPAVTMITPAENDTVGRKMNLKFNVTDPSGVRQVNIHLMQGATKQLIALTQDPSDDDIWLANDVDVSGLTSGEYSIVSRAVDNLGNLRAGTGSAHGKITVDNTAPETTLVVEGLNSNRFVKGKFTVSGDASDENGLNRVYVQLVSRQDSQRYGGTTINLLPEGDSAHWSRDYDFGAMNLPDGKYAAHVAVVDRFGNTKSVGWTEDFTIDNTAPVATLSATDTNPTIGDTVTVTGSAVEDGSGLKSHWFEIKTPNGIYYEKEMNATSNEYSFALDSSDGVGEYVIRYVATDKVKNRNDDPNYSDPKTLTITVKEAPVETGGDGNTNGDTTPGGSQTPASPAGGVPTGPLLQPATIPAPNTVAGFFAATNTFDANQADDGEVLGDTDADDEDAKDSDSMLGQANDGDSEVLGDSSDSFDWNFFGIMWYWWLLILAALAAAGWWIAAARRRKREEKSA